MGKQTIYIIAEIGINHNGDLNIAKRLIDIAKVAGCDVVKFQKRNPDVCVPEHQKTVMRDTPWGRMSYLDYKYKVEFGQNEYDEIDIYCKERNIHWSASPWDLDSLDFLNKYDVPLGFTIKVKDGRRDDFKEHLYNYQIYCPIFWDLSCKKYPPTTSLGGEEF